MLRATLPLCLSAALVALAAPARAQEAPPEAGPLDELAPADGVLFEAAPPAPTGDPVVDRLNALEAEVRALRSNNVALEEKLAAAEARIGSAEVRGARAAEWAGAAPTARDVAGRFSFKPRGALEVEQAAYFEREGGYDYNNGTGLRRARFGFDGTFLTDFSYRIETEFSGSQVQLFDAYVSWSGIKPWVVTIGQQKVPYSLDQIASQVSLRFMERSMFVNAFGGPSAGRRIGATVAYQTEKVGATFGVFGENETFTRSAAAPDEGWGVHGRVYWEPILDTGRLLHVGAGGFWRTGQRVGDVPRSFRVSDRPGTRVDGGLIADSGVIQGVDDVFAWNVEAAAIRGPFLFQAEYGKLYLSRSGSTAAFEDIDFSGYYLSAAWAITGETQAYRNGTVDKLRPLENFSPKSGGWGALELAFRYDNIDLTDSPGARAGNKADNIATALNWWFNPNLRFVFSWIRFWGTNTPLDPVGAETRGDVLQTRLHVDF